MHKFYHQIDNISGSVVTLRADGVRNKELAEIERSREVVVVVKHGLCAGFANRLESCKVDTAIYLILNKHSLKRVIIEKIDLIAHKVLACYFLYSLECLGLTVVEIIENYCIITRFEKLYKCMCADESRTARDKNCHFYTS